MTSDGSPEAGSQPAARALASRRMAPGRAGPGPRQAWRAPPATPSSTACAPAGMSCSPTRIGRVPGLPGRGSGGARARRRAPDRARDAHRHHRLAGAARGPPRGGDARPLSRRRRRARRRRAGSALPRADPRRLRPARATAARCWPSSSARSPRWGRSGPRPVPSRTQRRRFSNRRARTTERTREAAPKQGLDVRSVSRFVSSIVGRRGFRAGIRRRYPKSGGRGLLTAATPMPPEPDWCRCRLGNT